MISTQPPTLADEMTQFHIQRAVQCVHFAPKSLRRDSWRFSTHRLIHRHQSSTRKHRRKGVARRGLGRRPDHRLHGCVQRHERDVGQGSPPGVLGDDLGQSSPLHAGDRPRIARMASRPNKRQRFARGDVPRARRPARLGSRHDGAITVRTRGRLGHVRPARGLRVRAGPEVRVRGRDPRAPWYERAVDASESEGRHLELRRRTGLGPSGGEPRSDVGPRPRKGGRRRDDRRARRRTSSSPSPGTYSSPGPRVKSGPRNVKCDA